MSPTATRKALNIRRRSQPQRGDTSGRLPEPATARRLDTQALPGCKLASDLRLELGAVQQVASARAVAAAGGAWWGMAPALGQQRIGHRLERLELAHDAVAATPRARAAAAAPDRVLHDAHRELE